jgi:hypothetical protein
VTHFPPYGPDISVDVRVIFLWLKLAACPHSAYLSLKISFQREMDWEVIYLCGNGNRWDPYGAPRPGVLKGKPAKALVLDAAEDDSPAEDGWPSDDSDEVEAADEEEAISRCLESTEGSALI